MTSDIGHHDDAGNHEQADERGLAELQREKQRILAQQAEHTRQARHYGAKLAPLNKVLEPEKFELGALLPCFTPNTLVWTTDGPRSIGELREGDQVMAFDMRRACVVGAPILRIFTGRASRLYDISVDGTVVSATGSHRFWVDDVARWVVARELEQGMLLRSMAGTRVAIDRVVRRDAPETVTVNLHIAEHSTYFVQTGILVHNQGPAAYDFGPYMIYEARNLDYPDKIYIGQTKRTAQERQVEHYKKARSELKKPDLSTEDRRFFEFMRGAELTPSIMGLDEDMADYLEQKNIDLAGDRSLNRREQARDMDTLEKSIAAKQKVLEAGYCQ